MRLTGMASGLDTETLVKQMMKPYTMKVDKMKQDRQIVSWRQELYRDILSDTTAIRNTYFDVLKSDTNMLSKNNYAGFDVTATNSDQTKSAGVSATTSAGAVAGRYSVKVDKLATTKKVDGTVRTVNESNAISDEDAVKNWKGKTITFEIGGNKQSITIGDSEPVTPPAVSIVGKATLITEINRKIADNVELKNMITVSEGSNGGIKFNATGTQSIKVVSTETVGEIGMSNFTSPNRYTTKLSDLGIVDGGTLIFDYKDSNGATKTSEPIKVSKDATISQLMDAVSQGTSGTVKLNFSELTNKFNIESLETGSAALLKVTEGVVKLGDPVKGILTNLNLTGAVVGGDDAKVTITPPGSTVGIDVTKSSNTFSIDGVNYTLTKADTTNNITVTGNSQKTYDKIKGFIDKYNELVEKVSQKTDEKKQYKYLPLTDEQRTAMKEDEIKQWELKAKVGLLKGDSNLEGMLSSMRSAFFQGVEGSGIYLSDIGLSTSPITSERGKIIIDEKKLKTAIETRGEQVANLFAKQATKPYNADATSFERSERNGEQGIFQRINDILQDYTRTTGKKGILIQKAGLKGDVKSLLSEDIIKKDKKINEMIKSLSARENKFYTQFSKLEVAMNKLNSQSNWLTQQLSGGQ